MNDEARNPQDPSQSLASSAPGGLDLASEPLDFYCIPAPPAPGKMAWSISPWLPE
jgi:hypothetical protein